MSYWFPWAQIVAVHRYTHPSVHGWLLRNLVEASFDLFRYLFLGDQLEPWVHARPNGAMIAWDSPLNYLNPSDPGWHVS